MSQKTQPTNRQKSPKIMQILKNLADSFITHPSLLSPPIIYLLTESHSIQIRGQPFKPVLSKRTAINHKYYLNANSWQLKKSSTELLQRETLSHSSPKKNSSQTGHAQISTDEPQVTRGATVLARTAHNPFITIQLDSATLALESLSSLGYWRHFLLKHSWHCTQLKCLCIYTRMDYKSNTTTSKQYLPLRTWKTPTLSTLSYFFLPFKQF